MFIDTWCYCDLRASFLTEIASAISIAETPIKACGFGQRRRLLGERYPVESVVQLRQAHGDKILSASARCYLTRRRQETNARETRGFIDLESELVPFAKLRENQCCLFMRRLTYQKIRRDGASIVWMAIDTGEGQSSVQPS